MKDRSHILFVTTSSLAANPRLVKEFEALKNEYSCHVLCFKHMDWSLKLSEDIKKRNHEVTFIEIDRKKEGFQTIFSKLAHKTAIQINRRYPKSFKICAFANNDKALQLWLKTKNLQKNTKFSRVIAHNLGAFYASVELSESKDIALQLDIEDYYPGETLYFNKTLEKQNRMQLMAHSFLKANTITYASKGIQLECEAQFNMRNETKQIIIINSFNAIDFSIPKEKTIDTINCVWFSQHIGPNRGLEQVFDAAKQLTGFKFHIIGHPNHDFLEQWDLSDNIKIHNIMEQSNLHLFLAQMDVGLALEPGKDLNNTIALSNKIITYAQAGLYIIATNTFGQRKFLESLNYDAGVIIAGNLTDTLQTLDNKELSLIMKTTRWQSAKTYSWENEQLKLKTVAS